MRRPSCFTLRWESGVGHCESSPDLGSQPLCPHLQARAPDGSVLGLGLLQAWGSGVGGGDVSSVSLGPAQGAVVRAEGTVISRART